MLLAHKIELVPTQEQAVYFAKACGVARFAWNWALAEWDRQYALGLKPNEMALRRQLNAIKRKQFPWMLEVTKLAPAEAIRHLGKAFSRFFAKRAKRPKFKKKGVHDSFRAAAGPSGFRSNDKLVLLPVIGWVEMREAVRFAGTIKSATVSSRTGRWFVSILVDTPWEVPPRKNQAVAGIDLGIKAMATCSDGTTFDNPMPLRKELKKLKRLNRRLSRKVKGSKNRAKAKAKVAKLHYRIANVRKDALHKATTEIVRKFSAVGIEDLNVKGMTANHKIARAIGDVGLYEFRRQLTYKAKMYGTDIVVADRFYPSSKTCHVCEHVLDTLSLKEREWVCPQCGTHHDRDLNAAKNLAKLCTAGHAGAGPQGPNACGDRSSITSPVGVV